MPITAPTSTSASASVSAATSACARPPFLRRPSASAHAPASALFVLPPGLLFPLVASAAAPSVPAPFPVAVPLSVSAPASTRLSAVVVPAADLFFLCR